MSELLSRCTRCGEPRERGAPDNLCDRCWWDAPAAPDVDDPRAIEPGGTVDETDLGYAEALIRGLVPREQLPRTRSVRLRHA
jgi:hypothetical protein